MDIRKYKVNPQSETEGVWVPVGDGRLLIARYNNAKYQTAWRKRVREFWDKDEGKFKDIPADVLKRITGECLAEAILVGWDNISEGDVQVPYTKEKAYEYLMDPAMHDFQELVLEAAQDQARYRDRQLEAAAKN
jgi:hypothetical protein